MNRVLLASLRFSARSPGIGPRTENLGLCYLLGYLVYHGFQGEIFDANASGTGYESFIENADIHEYALIGFSVFSTNYLATIKAIERLRERGFKGHITMGGHYPSFNWKAILERHREVDSVVVGEGEEPLRALAQALSENKSHHTIPGLACHNGEAAVLNPPPPLIASLDFPYFPDRTFYEKLISSQNFSALSSSRGCWGSCAFCSVRNFYRLSKGESWRYRSPSHVVDELQKLNRSCGITNFAFFDDNFIGPGKRGKKRAAAIAREILKRKLDIVFSLECRPDDIDDALLSLLKEAGLVKISLGIESFVPRQQELYNKKLELEEVKNVVKSLDRLDIIYSLYLILFDPLVTFDELIYNLDCVSDIGPEHFRSFAGFLQVFSGIPLQERVREEGYLETNLIGKTESNEYWIQYRFHDERIGPLLKSWLGLEEQVGFCFGSIVPLIEDDKAFLIFKKLRHIIWAGCHTMLVSGKEIYNRETYQNLLAAVAAETVQSAEAVIKQFSQ
ncbi:MAG: radical SAM protein [Vulcanimicrobiota bacterium]